MVWSADASGVWILSRNRAAAPNSDAARTASPWDHGQQWALRTALLQLQMEAGLQVAENCSERKAAVAEAVGDAQRER